MRAKVSIEGTLDEELLQEFLQVVRHFDAEHPDRCHFRIVFGSAKNVEEMNRILDQIRPPFSIRNIVRKQ